jgi:hypothetical protein
VNPEIDETIMYRNKSTGELLSFDEKGCWNWEGISHKDLNEVLK